MATWDLRRIGQVLLFNRTCFVIIVATQEPTKCCSSQCITIALLSSFGSQNKEEFQTGYEARDLTSALRMEKTKSNSFLVADISHIYYCKSRRVGCWRAERKSLPSLTRLSADGAATVPQRTYSIFQLRKTSDELIASPCSGPSSSPARFLWPS